MNTSNFKLRFSQQPLFGYCNC